ncbi:helix-turn-helix domain-containing protein [Mucisphaera sp.]|uniref:helix-turn-helix domain-containing protein n=1 Tax=Mucisphaera sp. TaxID=2913024 RepID=UPI003D0B18ED
MPSLTDAIRRAITTSAETRYRIAQGSGVSQAHLSRLVRHESGTSIENAERIADYLGYDIKLIPRPHKARRKPQA